MKALAVNKSRLFLMLISAAILFLQTGCWSKDEIEDLSIYIGMALDIGEQSKVEKALEKQGAGYARKKAMTFTIQIINELKGGKGDKTPAAEQKAYINMSETGDSIFEMIREFSTRMERPVIGHHLKVIVVNEKLARRKRMDQLLDFFLRDNDIRPSAVVFISKSKASHTLETQSSTVVPAFRLLGITDNQYRSLKIMSPVTLAKLEGKMHAGMSYVLQNVVSAKGEVAFSGAAVIKGSSQKLIGFLNEKELVGLMLLSGQGKGGQIKAYHEERGEVISYEIKKLESKINAIVKNGKVTFEVEIETTGRVMEEWTPSELEINEAFTKQTEAAVKEEIEKLVLSTLAKLQDKYKTDVAGFGQRLRIQHPKVWEPMKKDWDEEFSQIPVTIHIKSKITEYGATSRR
ncbi:spore germination protein [Paenibacillus harenae]|uniref:Spore germination protein n=2 Tax=Paenibacillus harenae TaxID=306543 RepID=A0ABT9TVB2_PAEHA|nr:spore germination protein [Paenibacillus harenae]